MERQRISKMRMKMMRIKSQKEEVKLSDPNERLLQEEVCTVRTPTRKMQLT